jgi:hypothetical protein
MKKLCLTVGLLGVMVATVFGQGQVTVQNYISPGNSANAIIGNTNGTPLSGGTYLVDILYGTDTSHLTQDALALGELSAAIPFLTGGGAGYFAANNITLASGYVGTVSFELVVWQASAGSTWVAATGGGANPSDATYLANGGTEWGEYIFTLTGITGTGLTSIAQGAGTLVSFNLTPVPEPATCALMGLGGLSLLLFRRRK